VGATGITRIMVKKLDDRRGHSRDRS